MKLIFWMLCLLPIGLSAQINVTVNGNIFNTKMDSIYLSKYQGGSNYVDFVRGKVNKDGNFSLKGKLPYADYYVLRIGQNHINLIMRDQSNIKIYADGKNIVYFSNIVNSDESANMNELIKVMTRWNFQKDSAMQIIQKDPSKQEEVSNSMNSEFYKYQGYIQSFIGQNQNSAALYPIISTINVENDFATYESLVTQIYASFPESPSIQQLKAQYEQYKKQKEAADRFAPGKTAPDFEELKTDGVQKMKLSDLRGQVVLLDFWASWCGPCRKENPNVVNLYKKYEKEGFTVMSVSLDKDKAAWLAAIEKDQLTWPNHVSDLQAWSSKAAALYGVRGIPFTVLIDRDGTILGTNLRGQDLANKLAELFGK